MYYTDVFFRLVQEAFASEIPEGSDRWMAHTVMRGKQLSDLTPAALAKVSKKTLRETRYSLQNAIKRSEYREREARKRINVLQQALDALDPEKARIRKEQEHVDLLDTLATITQ